MVGGSQLPCMADMTEAQLQQGRHLRVHEERTRRCLGTHSNNSPVIVEGFTIPANSHVIPNLHALQHVAGHLWAEPEEFNPERFLDAEVNFSNLSLFLPFGAGQRMCLGDNVAETELQLSPL